MSMAPERGILGIRRHFTTDGTDPYDDIDWEVRTALVLGLLPDSSDWFWRCLTAQVGRDVPTFSLWLLAKGVGRRLGCWPVTCELQG